MNVMAGGNGTPEWVPLSLGGAVDGAQLAELMIDHNVGVTTVKRLDIKRVDSDYFTVE